MFKGRWTLSSEAALKEEGAWAAVPRGGWETPEHCPQIQLAVEPGEAPLGPRLVGSQEVCHRKREGTPALLSSFPILPHVPTFRGKPARAGPRYTQRRQVRSDGTFRDLWSPTSRPVP